MSIGGLEKVHRAVSKLWRERKAARSKYSKNMTRIKRKVKKRMGTGSERDRKRELYQSAAEKIHCQKY